MFCIDQTWTNTHTHTHQIRWRPYLFSLLLSVWSPAASLLKSYKNIAWDLDLFNNSGGFSTPSDCSCWRQVCRMLLILSGEHNSSVCVRIIELGNETNTSGIAFGQTVGQVQIPLVSKGFIFPLAEFTWMFLSFK